LLAEEFFGILHAEVVKSRAEFKGDEVEEAFGGEEAEFFAIFLVEVVLDVAEEETFLVGGELR
jgi:hypothetical protein